MYLNLDLIHERGFNLFEVSVLQIIRQNRSENLEDGIATYINDNMLKRFEELSLITSVKKKTKDTSDFEVLRTTAKANKILDDIKIKGVSVQDIEMFDYLCEMYLKNDDKERVIGNKKKIKGYIAQFRAELGINVHEMYYLCLMFLNEYIYTKKLENIFFDANKNRYSKFEDNIEESPLYQFYDENKKRVEEFWKVKIK